MKATLEQQSKNLIQTDPTPPELTLALARSYALLACALRSDAYLKQARECASLLKRLIWLDQIEQRRLHDDFIDAA